MMTDSFCSRNFIAGDDRRKLPGNMRKLASQGNVVTSSANDGVGAARGAQTPQHGSGGPISWFSAKPNADGVLQAFGRKLAKFTCASCNQPFALQGAEVVADTNEMLTKKGEWRAAERAKTSEYLGI